jgi:hypothetical protein
MKSRFLKCTDGQEAIEFCLDDSEPISPLVYVSMWKLGNDVRPLSFKERLRWIWKIIRTGNPWADQIVLSHADFKNCAYIINDLKRDMDKSYEKWCTNNGVEVI